MLLLASAAAVATAAAAAATAAAAAAAALLLVLLSVFFFLPALLRKCCTELTDKFWVRTLKLRKNVRGDSIQDVFAAAVAPAVVLRRNNIHVPVLNGASQIDYCRY